MKVIAKETRIKLKSLENFVAVKDRPKKKTSVTREKNLIEVWEMMERKINPLPPTQALSRLSNLLDEPYFDLVDNILDEEENESEFIQSENIEINENNGYIFKSKSIK